MRMAVRTKLGSTYKCRLNGNEILYSRFLKLVHTSAYPVGTELTVKNVGHASRAIIFVQGSVLNFTGVLGFWMK